jgi:hypothetical protein
MRIGIMVISVSKRVMFASILLIAHRKIQMPSIVLHRNRAAAFSALTESKLVYMIRFWQPNMVRKMKTSCDCNEKDAFADWCKPREMQVVSADCR